MAIITIVFASFGIAQPGSNEIRSGVTDPGVEDSVNDTMENDSTTNTTDNAAESSSACGRSPADEASSTAHQVLNTIFCTAGNIGDALSSLLG